MSNRFAFTGELALPKDGSKRPLLKKSTTKDGRDSLSMNFGVKAGAGNMAFVEAFDAYQDTIKSMSKDNEKIEISWDDRLDDDVINEVANYRKYTVDLGEENGGRVDFISQYDMIEHLAKHLPNYKGRVTVTGQYTKEFYNGKYFDRFRLQNVYEAQAERRNRLELDMEMYHNKDCVDKSEFKESKKVFVNGFTSQYINATDGVKMIPHQFILNLSKCDNNNPEHAAHKKYLLRFVDIKDKTYQAMQWKIALVRGAEEVEFDESMLTDAQREQVELGFKKVEDFKPRGNFFGDRINEFRLRLPDLKAKGYEEGIVDTGMKQSEFEEQLYIPASGEEKMSTAKKSGSKKENKSGSKKDEVPFDVDEDDVDMDDIFN